MKRALITGITGQDGSYLAELLLDKGYEVHGIVRRSSSISTSRIDHLYVDSHDPGARLLLHYGDVLDPMGIMRVVDEVTPHEIYNLAAQSHVAVSFDQPAYTFEANAVGVTHMVEIVRQRPNIKLYQASSSEMFGNQPVPQHEDTRMEPVSPYGVAKFAAHRFAVNARERKPYPFICCGILFNHESPRRDERMVTRKITRAAGRIKWTLQEKLYLGNLNAKRDWGFAGDYVRAMWMMLQQSEPDDYVIATGVEHTVDDVVRRAFMRAQQLSEYNARNRIEVDPRYYRPKELHHLCGDASKARDTLGWTPTVDFGELIDMMVDADLELAEQEYLTKGRSSSTLVATTE